MQSRWWLACAVLGIAASTSVRAGDEHWSRQLPKPAGSTKMLPGTGMSDGTNKPIVKKAKWHEGKLWMAGAWEPGASGWNIADASRNHYWYLWTWSPTHGYEPVCHFHSAQGGIGPDGKILDFVFLPDGRLVVGGSFTRLDNPGGIMYHRVDALAIFDPKEPSANKWKPLGTFQYDGTVSPGGSVLSLAYDPQGNDLDGGGDFGGIQNGRSLRKYPESSAIHRYDFDTQSYEPLSPGLPGPVRKIQVDTSTQPSTIYLGGRFKWAGGDDNEDPIESGATTRYTVGFASWQEGKGWRTFPEAGVKPQDGGDEAILKRAEDFMFRDAPVIHDFLVDGEDIWIVGAFSQGSKSDQTIRGIAKWDQAGQRWIDPTGKGGVGRDVFSIGKAENGKIYFAGAFGGRTNKGFYNGFNDGTPAHLAMSYDPATQTWEQLGSGLGSRSMPECRLAIDGNDVYFLGDFNYIGGEREGKNSKEDKAFESWYIARWNETVDFVANPPEVAEAANQRQPFTPPTQGWSEGNEHWSRSFPKPPPMKGKDHQMTGKTGMDDGTGAPQISGVAKIGDTLYFCGRWEAIRNTNWFVWTHHPEQGWNPVAWQTGADVTGPGSPPKGMKVRDGKLWVYGAISNMNGICWFDPETSEWHQLEGKTAYGQPVMGASADPKRSVPVNDIAWDDKTGDLYMVGSSGYIENPELTKSPKSTGQVIKRTQDGVYSALGWALMAEYPAKPVLLIDSIYLDQTQDPVGIYIGGTFNYYGETSNNSRMLYNVARYDHTEKDWRPVGKGVTLFLSELDQKHYPEGLPGLPALPELYHGFLAAGFPRVRCMTMDKEGNLYVGGTLAVVSDRFPIHERNTIETFGIARLNAKTQQWERFTEVGGFSRDVFQMTWLDEGRTRMLVSGGFHFDDAWRPLHGAALIDVPTGKISPLGGGLLRWSLNQTISSDVSHFVDGDDYYFAGLFDHAGINQNTLVGAPIESYYVAHWNGTKNFDPAQGLKLGEVAPLEKPSGFSSKSFKVELTATSRPCGRADVVREAQRRQVRGEGQGPQLQRQRAPQGRLHRPVLLRDRHPRRRGERQDPGADPGQVGRAPRAYAPGAEPGQRRRRRIPSAAGRSTRGRA
ncbi:MAG: hypothetical protein R3F62_30465 [Planctomycetota bacterium]